MKGRFKMFFVIAIFNFLFFSLQIEAFNSSLLACKLALNPFSTFQPSKISKGDIEEMGCIPELNYASKEDLFSFFKRLKYAKFCVGCGITSLAYGASFYCENPVGLILTSIVFMPTAAYLSQLNKFEKKVKQMSIDKK